MKPLAIIKIGTTFPGLRLDCGDFDTWVREGLGHDSGPVSVIDVEAGDPLPLSRDVRGVVVTGSHAMVTDRLEWSESLAGRIRLWVYDEVPVLGICYGHQLLAHALGGLVDYHPQGREMGTVDIDLFPACSADPLFRGLPPRFPVHATHAQTVLRLPEGAVCLAGNDFEATHAYRVGEQAWGVQFHPEYSSRILKAYIDERAADLESQGHDLPAIYRTVKETPEASSILKRFAHIAKKF